MRTAADEDALVWSALLGSLVGNDGKWLGWPAFMAWELALSARPNQNAGFSLAVGLRG